MIEKIIIVSFILIAFTLIFASAFEQIIKIKNTKNRNNEGELRSFKLSEYNLNRRRIIHTNKNEYWLYDNVKDTCMENRSVPFEIDEKGFILPNYQDENADYRIFFLGDSTTESAIVTPEKRFPFLVGKLLNESGILANSYNCGYSGADSYRMNMVLLSKCMPLHPTHACLCTTTHDINSMLIDNDYSLVMKKHNELINCVQNNGNIMKRVKGSIRELFPNLYTWVYSCTHKPVDSSLVYERVDIDVIKSRILNKARQNYQTFIDICRNYEIEPLLMTQPNTYSKKNDRLIRIYENTLPHFYGISYDEYANLFNNVTKLVTEIAAENNIKCVDLASIIEPNVDLIYDYVHLTDEGSQRAAEAIVNVIKEQYISKKV